MADLWDTFSESVVGSVSRKIDNELNSDYLPSPKQSTNEAPVVKTSEDARGTAKYAGTGSNQIVGGVTNTHLIIAGVSVVALVGLLIALR